MLSIGLNHNSRTNSLFLPKYFRILCHNCWNPNSGLWGRITWLASFYWCQENARKYAKWLSKAMVLTWQQKQVCIFFNPSKVKGLMSSSNSSRKLTTFWLLRSDICSSWIISFNFSLKTIGHRWLFVVIFIHNSVFRIASADAQ